MQGYTRRQLKQDRFAETTKDAFDWTAEHQRPIVWGLVFIVVVVGGYFAYNAWESRQSEVANAALGNAMRTFTDPIRPAGAPADAGGGSFASIADRAKAAGKEFKVVADKYSYTKPGKIARYMEGVTAAQAGDAAGAEQQLKSVAGSTDKNVAALAKMALAMQYRSANKLSDATRIYKDLEAHPTGTVSKAQAQLAMAEMYESVDPQEAATLYKQIQTENPNNAAGQLAATRLASAK